MYNIASSVLNLFIYFDFNFVKYYSKNIQHLDFVLMKEQSIRNIYKSFKNELLTFIIKKWKGNVLRKYFRNNIKNKIILK